MRKPGPIFLIVTSLIVAATSTAFAQRGGQGRGHGRGPGHGQGSAVCQTVIADRFDGLPVEPLSDAERAAVLHIREEEKLARDVYTTLGETWQLPVFDHIAAAEQHHMDHVALLVERYELDDPVVDDAVGVFSDPELGALYTRLVADGRTSLEHALRVGATIEDLDLADVQTMIDASDNRDILLVANNLAKGSRNHLRAFTGALDRQGYEPYTAQHLSQEQVDAILAADHERRVVYDEHGEAIPVGRGGAGAGCGRAHGQGGGKGKGACERQGQGHGQGHGNGTGCCKKAGPTPGVI